jgi:hypothetical protein
MIRKHKIQFFFWKIYCQLLGINIDKLVVQYSESKNEFIIGRITGFAGESVTRKIMGASYHVKWFKPFQGDDPQYYIEGWYELKDLNKKIFLIQGDPINALSTNSKLDYCRTEVISV